MPKCPLFKGNFWKVAVFHATFKNQSKKATAFKMMNFAEITCAKAAVKVALKTAKWRKNT